MLPGSLTKEILSEMQDGDGILPIPCSQDKETTMKKCKMITVSLLIAVMLLACMSGFVCAQEETDFTLSQSTENALPGQVLEITVNGNNLKDLYAYEAVLSYDPAVVEFDKAESKLEGFFITPNVDDGKLTAAFTKIGKKAGEKGNIPLCTIAFKGKVKGNANIRLVSVKALDPNLTATVYKNTTKLSKTFNDLEGYGWARMQIEALASQGIIKGTSETTFSPGMNITRADFICLLVRSFNLTADVESNYQDVALSDYFYKEVGIARKLGVAQGVGNDQLRPRESMTRQDMMVCVARAMKIAGRKLDESASDLSRFKDSGEVAPYAVSSVAQLVNKEIILGSNGRINPKGKATRAETAVIMYRILNK